MCSPSYAISFLFFLFVFIFALQENKKINLEIMTPW